jgi:hypothetical protein
MISTAKAKELGINYTGNDYNYYPEKPTIKITVGNKELVLPVLVFPVSMPIPLPLPWVMDEVNLLAGHRQE